MPAGEHAHAEGFPRAETAELVGAALAAEHKRWRLQVALVSLGVTGLVLGLPTASIGSISVEQIWPTARGEWTGLNLLPSMAARALTAITGMRAYQAWYLVSALATGITTALLLVMARRRGATPLRAILLSLLAISIPMAWLAATIPNASSCELLGAVWLFSVLDKALDGERDERWTRRATIAWLGASLLHAWNVYLWPACALAIWFNAPGQRRRGNVMIAFGALLIWPAIVAGAWRIEHDARDWPAFFATSWRAMLASGSGGWGPLVAWSLAWTVALGVGTFGILRFAHVAFTQAQRRPPAWMIVFALVPLAILGLGGFIGFDVPWLWLVPIAFAGFLDGTFLPAWLLAALAVAGVVAIRSIGPSNPQIDWQNLAVMRLHPSDFVVCTSIQHSEFLQGLRVEQLQIELARSYDGGSPVPPWADLLGRAERARAEGHRIVLDVGEPDHGGEWVRLAGPDVQRLRELGAVDLDAPGL